MTARVLYIFNEASEMDRTLCQELENWVHTLFYEENHTTKWHTPLAGADAAIEMQRSITQADVILLLVSVDLFLSEDCRRQMHQALTLTSSLPSPRLVPILLRPVVSWADQGLSRFQPLPRNGRPVTQWARRDDAWQTIAMELRIVLTEIGRASARPLLAESNVLAEDPENTLPLARTSSRPPPRSPLTRLAIDSDIGSYRIAREVALRKASGIYEAHHRYLRRKAAIKTLHPNEAFRSRELQLHWEATATMIAEHPSVVKLYDAGILSNGCPYLILEYLDGITLADFARTQRQFPQFVQAVIWACSHVALTAAAFHNAGVVHCDLKPENIMLCLDSGRWRTPKIFDFGIAQIGGPSPPPVPFNDNYTIGAVPYMSPEQARGYHCVSEKSDVYTLGVTIFKLISGRLPFLGNRTEMIRRHAHEQPPSLHSVAPHAPRYLSGLVKSMLAKTPDARPTMLEVSDHLSHALQAEPYITA